MNITLLARRILVSIGVVLFSAACLPAEEAPAFQTLDIAPVWAGHPVGFCLLTHPPHQFVAFYDADRKMTVAARRLTETARRFVTLPEEVGWDSHNSIVMAIDDTGCVHLAGNMHVHPLRYFRTREPFDIETFERVAAMIGQEENQVTYPQFFRGPNNEFLFTYRHGRSGSGSQIYNVYDAETRTWRRLLDQPLVDGEGRRNAYFDGPLRGPDGFFHLCWVWRDTPDCATNNNLSYARSRDLLQWERSNGQSLALPITLATAEIVDPVPSGGGIINGNHKIGFDLENRVVITYHKFDAAGNTQLFHARLEEGAWVIRQHTQWDYRWEFQGGGTIPFEIGVSPVRVESGHLVQEWRHSRYGRQRWRVDPATLQPLERVEIPPDTLPDGFHKVRSDFPGMQVRTCGDSGQADRPGIRYLLRWETLGQNRDKPRDPPWPAPRMLRLYAVPK